MPFTVNIICDVTSFPLTSRPLDKEYVLYDGAVRTEPFTVTQVEECNLPETITHTFTQDGVPVAHPPEIEWDPVSRTYVIDATSKAVIGEWDITTEISVTHPITGVSFTRDETYTVNILSDCVNTYFIDRDYNDMWSLINGDEDLQNVALDDVRSVFHNEKDYCGTRSYEFTPDYPFVTMNGDELSL